MPIWGNTDRANNKPLFPEMREVVEVASLVTANATTAGNTIIFTTNPTTSGITAGMYAYTLDANNALARYFDTSIVTDVDYYRANNSVRAIADAANGVVTFANNVIGTIASGEKVYFGTAIVYGTANTQYRFANDTILVTSTRLANALIAGANSGIHQGWNRFTYKVNNDGTKRQLRETLVVLANPVAINVSSGNTSTNSVFSGL
jgi:hypothetical protein